MKSLYLAIVLAMVVILALSVMAVVAINRSIINSYFNPVFDRMDEVEVQESVEMLRTTGPKAVAAYMHRLDSVFGGTHYLLNADGTDVLTGTNLSQFVPEAPLTKWRGEKHRKNVVAHQSGDGRYWFLVVSPVIPKDAPLYKYFLLVAGVCVLLCWLAAIYVVSPLRRIAGGISRFGEGDLSVRLQVQRSDEIGTLAASFNSMAQRIQTLFECEQRLLADVSHELRSPLARLHFSVKLARTAEDREAALDRVKRDVDRLSTLVSSLVEMARAEGGLPTEERERVDINELVAGTIHDCSVEVEARGGHINLSAAPVSVVFGNPELLRRTVENVIRNAIRHSPQNNAIDVSVERCEEVVMIAVRDYGPGVPEEFIERIFDSFFRIEEARDSDSGGVGLGLAIAKRAVQIHGGVIRARNANPGLRVEIELHSAGGAMTSKNVTYVSESMQN